MSNIPRTGPAILASNHLSFSDSIFLPLVVPRRVTFPAKMEYFTGPGVKGKLTAAFFRGTGQIPIDRSGGDASQAAMSAGERILNDGGLFGIYPEGTRSPDGKLYKGKTGLARLALATGAPIIPVAMIDTDKVQPIGQKMPQLHRVGIVVGKPMYFPQYRAVAVDRAIAREVTDAVMKELRDLSGQEYVDEYAAVVKRRRAAEKFRMATSEAAALATEARAKALLVTEKVRDDVSGRAKEVSVRASETVAKARADLSEKAKLVTDKASERLPLRSGQVEGDDTHHTDKTDVADSASEAQKNDD